MDPDSNSSNATKKRVLIVDDEQDVRESLKLLLAKRFEVFTAEDGSVALEMLDKINPDLILLDVMMPTLGGIETLERINEREQTVPVIMLTGSNTVKTAVQAMKSGAVDYLSKPFEVEELTSLIIETLDSQTLPLGTIHKSGSVEPSAPDADFGIMVGKSEEMQELFRNISQVAACETTILITGESGTGKELIARRLHEMSDRAKKPFIPINCAAIPETLIESELFGHEKGAFTNAFDRRIGHFELADGGTLFLDEIGELSLPVQVKMLRFLQEHEFYRVGKSKPIRVDVRVIAATNKNLEDLIKEKKFRQDLYYRINVVNISAPPLRDRKSDIPAFTEYFVKKFASVYGDRELNFTKEAKNILTNYDWPGNVRELENVIESLMALSPSDKITPENLPPKLTQQQSGSLDILKSSVFEGAMNFEEAEKQFEKEIIEKALKRTNNVQTKAAELLGISRRILKYKMDKLGIGEKESDS